MRKIASNLFYYAFKGLKKVKLDSIIFTSKSPIDHIVDNIYLGDFRAADNIELLTKMEITHIINCADNIPEQFPTQFNYLPLKLKDDKKQDLTEAIQRSLEFIHQSDVENKKVFIHCKQGVSRSCSIVVAYLISSKNMSYDEAIEVILKERNVVLPNPNFESQLRKFEEMIKSTGNSTNIE
jgi:protein-tyrosine phosphatase